MARNRQEIPRDERYLELITEATALFLKHGYAQTSIADISAAAGVAPANVYWYFQSKDELFAAVMDRMLQRELDYGRQDLDPLTALVRGLGDMRVFRGLHQEMHTRMLKSEAVREAHERFLDWIRALVGRVVDEQPETAERRMIIDIVVSLFEGANVSEPASRPATEMIRFLLKSLGAFGAPNSDPTDLVKNDKAQSSSA
ncbi:TetR/AcrR family transcriptional regulator [Pseudarthrobacter raffinosi]|uniref:TetR/AcrR family transcriptional regulator n=1 Tax=Pseudarthrobacter raffinosi TaxID=2953651 RepID=UPI00208F8BA1|nr:TetR/AcrR family transcriptional regulator [Pseudarthrobacter sp. MDT3-9]MCO4252128.1 TetR/AcrR family transcriptional regulator [Pseudarthrobacter sp. MDT3-9]